MSACGTLMRYGRILVLVLVLVLVPAVRAAVCCEVLSLLVMCLTLKCIGVSFWHQ